VECEVSQPYKYWQNYSCVYFKIYGHGQQAVRQKTDLNCSKHSFYIHVEWVPCHHGMERPQVADGGDGLQIWRVAANVLNKKSRTANTGWSYSLVVGRGAKNLPL
jgi:hypothetical protein